MAEMKMNSIITQLIGMGILLVLWFVLYHWGVIGKTVLAGPDEVFFELTKLNHISDEPSLASHFLGTLTRCLTAWLVVVFLGLVIGGCFGLWLRAYLFLEPCLEFFRAIPPVLLLPVFLVAFDYQDEAYIATIIIGCLPMMIMTLAKAVQRLEWNRLELLRSYGATLNIRIFAFVMEILPGLILGMRLTISWSIIIGTVTEMVVTPRSGISIGAVARDAEISFDTPKFYACVILVGSFGYLVNLIFRLIEQRLSPQLRDF